MGGVPMIDRNPVEPRAQVPLDVAHEIAGIGAKVPEFGSVLRRYDEAEMMTVIAGPLREGRDVGRVVPSIEEASCFAVLGHAVSLEIGDVRGEPSSASARHPRLDDDLPSRRPCMKTTDHGRPPSPEGACA